jgi:hypothetical protein
MYGPQRAEGYTKEQVKKILADVAMHAKLERIHAEVDDLIWVRMEDSDPKVQRELALLVTCLDCLRRVTKARRGKIPQEFL